MTTLCRKCKTEINTPPVVEKVVVEGVEVEITKTICQACGLKTTNTKASSKSSDLPGDMLAVSDNAACLNCGGRGMLEKSNTVKAICCDKEILREDVYKCVECGKTFIKRNIPGGARMDALNKIIASLPVTLRDHYQKEV